jgi:putative heme-binding domain-containing protein
MKIGSITDHGHQKTAYCGIVNLDSDAFPLQYRERICVGNVHAGCINVDRLVRDGATYLGKGEPDLLTAHDDWAMPVSLKLGPDGFLYVLDWYDRYHCSQDAIRDPDGVDRLRGRLYRLRYGDSPRSVRLDLAAESDHQLVARLASNNLYLRETAQRLLTERLAQLGGQPTASGAAPANRRGLSPFVAGTTAPVVAEQKGTVPFSADGSPPSSDLRAALERLVLDAAAPRKARLHALWTLIGGDALLPPLHKKLLSHADPTFRAWAVRAAGNQGKIAPEIRDAIVALAHDPAADVQLQVAIASRKIEGCDALPVLVDVLATCGHDKIIPAIAWSNLHPLLETDGPRFVSLLKSVSENRRGLPAIPPSPLTGEGRGEGVVEEKGGVLLPAGRAENRLSQGGQAHFAPRAPQNEPVPDGSRGGKTAEAAAISPAASTLLPRILERLLAAREPNVEAVSTLLQHVLAYDAPRGPECVAAISARVGGLGEPALAQLKQQLRPMVMKTLADQRPTPLRLSMLLLAARLKLASGDPAEVRRMFVSAAEEDDTRLQALEAMIAFRDPTLPAALPEVLGSASPALTTRVFTALSRVEDPRLGDVLLAQYPKLAPELQPLAVDLIMQREPWAKKMLTAVLAGTLPKSILDANQLRKIMDSNDREAIWAVEKAFGKVRDQRNPEREKIVAEMGAYLRKNLGDPVAGQRVFKTLCAQCHTIYGEGHRVGPDLTSNGRGTFDQVVVSVFDPSLVIGPGYQSVTVVTEDGRNLTGLIVEDSPQQIVLRMAGGGEVAVPRNNVQYTRVSKLSMMPEGIETVFDKQQLSDLFAFLSLDKPPSDPTAKPIPGAPAINAAARIKLQRHDSSLVIRARLPGKQDWNEIATFVMDPQLRPYLHPLRDATGSAILTEDKPADHVWQHGIFTGFHQVNGLNYWKEDQGQQHFVKLLDVKESPQSVSWRALVNLVDPHGAVVLEEEDTITIHAPESPDAYLIDFELLLRAKEADVKFGKYFVGGLSARMPWDKANPRQTHLNSNGDRNRRCEQRRAEWCNVERPFGEEIYGIAIFDHPSNSPHPPGWRADEQGLINPNVSALSDWSIPAGKQRVFRYQLLIYHDTATREQLQARYQNFTAAAAHAKN